MSSHEWKLSSKYYDNNVKFDLGEMGQSVLLSTEKIPQILALVGIPYVHIFEESHRFTDPVNDRAMYKFGKNGELHIRLNRQAIDFYQKASNPPEEFGYATQINQLLKKMLCSAGEDKCINIQLSVVDIALLPSEFLYLLHSLQQTNQPEVFPYDYAIKALLTSLLIHFILANVINGVGEKDFKRKKDGIKPRFFIGTPWFTLAHLYYLTKVSTFAKGVKPD